MTRAAALPPIELAGAPVSWGVDFADDAGNPPPEVVLDGIAALGLRSLELGPPGYLPADPSALSSRGMTSVATFVFEPFHDAAARELLLASTSAALDWLDRHGGRYLILIDRPSGERARAAGRSRDGGALDNATWGGLVDSLRRASVAASERGCRALLHPHAGSHIEYAHEIDRLLEAVPPDEAGLCLDTGHALYAGDDPCALVRRYGSRIEHLHLKDVHDGRLAEALATRRDFWSGVAAGVFCPIGDGLLDPTELQRALQAIHYGGIATIEQDRRRGTRGSPEDDLARSVRRLRRSGFGLSADRMS